MTAATGIPTHTQNHEILKLVCNKVTLSIIKVRQYLCFFKKVVSDAIEEKMASNGHLSADVLGRSMD